MRLKRTEAIDILNAALSTGAEYAGIYYQDCVTHSYSRRYKKVNGVFSTRSCGVGIRIFLGKEVVYGYTSDLSFSSLVHLAKSLADGIHGEKIIHLDSMSEVPVKQLNPVQIPHSEWSVEKKLSYLKKGEDAAFHYSPLIVDVMTSLSEEDSVIEIYNSTGHCFHDDRVKTKIAAYVIASDGKQFQSAFNRPSLSEGLELLEETDFVKMASEEAKLAVDMLSAPYGPDGEMPVVLGKGFGGVLFHEACGHPLEGDSISEKTSPFYDKLGKQIATPILNAYDDGTIENAWGTESIDDEGMVPTKNHLITNGVLTGFMLDRYNAKLISPSLSSTGALRRDGFRSVPTTRMTNTYIDNGTSDPKDIIASVKKGVYCQGFTGGQVDSTDKFIFTSDVAYTIENGRIGHLIKPVSLIGYGYDILKKITVIGNDLELSPGECGASSGDIAVSVGQPTLLISNILVGSNGGKKE